MNIKQKDWTFNTDGTITVRRMLHCFRCGRNHKDLTLKKFAKHMTVGNMVFPYWVMCPTTNEPIIVRIEEH